MFVGSNDGVFRALDLLTGKEIWQIEGQDKFPTGAVVVASPDGTDDWMLVNGYDGVARCLRAKDGTEVWQHETAGLYQRLARGARRRLGGVRRLRFGDPCDPPQGRRA